MPRFLNQPRVPDATEPAHAVALSQLGAGVPVLVDSNGQGWQVTAGLDGALVTAQTSQSGESGIEIGGGWVLAVDTDGVLITEGA